MKILSTIIAMVSFRRATAEDHHTSLLTLLDTYHPIEIPQNMEDVYNQMLDWCFTHCTGKFRDMRHGQGTIWYFEIPEDATLFSLKWQ